MKKALLTIVAILCIASTGYAAKKTTVKQKNPFLSEYKTKYEIPPFSQISYDDYLPAMQAGIDQQNQQIADIIANKETPNFENTVLALDNSGEILNRVQLVFMALVESDNTPEMQALAEKLSPMMTAQSDEIYMNDALFQKIKAVNDNADRLGLDPVQKRLTQKYYRRFVRNGALLNEQDKATLKDINKQTGALSLQFTNNVMHDMANCVIYVTNRDDLSGLPQQTIDDAAKLATEKGHDGQWAFSASGATRLAVLTSANNRDLRRQMYELYTTTASHGDQWDNAPIINKLIQLRQRKARLLGYDTFADYATADVMAGSPEAAYDLLMQLWRPAIKKVDEEVADMQRYADSHGDNITIDRWDYYYYADKVKKEKFNLSDDDVRPYFKIDNVVKDGIFYVANRLFGLTFTEMKDAPKYNPEVTVYDVKDRNGKHLAVFMTDYFPRATKAQGAWMSEMKAEYNYNGVSERPIIFNVASMTPPTKDMPSLLTLDEVQTVFHEFGHALNGMLTIAPFRGLEGTNVDRDLVEMFSQLNEHWALVPEVLQHYAHHYKTGEVIPQSLIDKLIASSKFNMGFMTTELVGAALLDIEWHKMNYVQGDVDVKAFEQAVARRLNMPKIVEYRYRSPYFKHIFDNDQYSCGYYTYLWSQVLEADGWERFEKEGAMNLQTAAEYRVMLESGDTIDPMQLFINFRGQKPTADALLHLRGLK